MPQRTLNPRFNKLTLKRNKIRRSQSSRRSSYIVILDDSVESVKSPLVQNMHGGLHVYSPIIISDSSEFESSFQRSPSASKEEEPSKSGNVSCSSRHDVSLMEVKDVAVQESRPSIGGWSQHQSIICATPKNLNVPSTPKDVANISQEKCSIKKIQQSQKKLLCELYGDEWKSIPRLFKGSPSKKDKDDDVETVCRKLDYDDDSDKENIRHHIAINRHLYLTGSDVKAKERTETGTEKKSKKKLYTEKIPNTPDPKFRVKRDPNQASQKKLIKGKSVTELVETMKDKFKRDMFVDESDADTYKPSGSGHATKADVSDKRIGDILKIKTVLGPRDNFANVPKECRSTDLEDKKKTAPKIPEIRISPVQDDGLNRLTFVGSMADNVPSSRCNLEAIRFIDGFKTMKEELARKLFSEFNTKVFDAKLDADMPIVWNNKMRSTAGTTTNRLVKRPNGERLRFSSIKMSIKVNDSPVRLRDTLIHEMCHAATWLIDDCMRAGHGPLWRKWACRALTVFPELGNISRCHNMEIHYKYSYKCIKCGYTINRHSKSLDIQKKCCGYCHGTFQIIVNRKNKDGVVVSTPARQREITEFALYVKNNYKYIKDGQSHAEVMKILGQNFAAAKKKTNGVDG